MGTTVVKPSPDDDFYVLWSDFVEAPLAFGDRAYLVEYLIAKPESPGDIAELRVARAERTGTSAVWPDLNDPAYGWKDDIFIYRQMGIIRRHNLKTLCERLARSEVDPCSDLLEPFEDAEGES